MQNNCAGSGACNDMRDPRQKQRQVLTCQNKRNLSKIVIRQNNCAGICRDAERVAGAKRKAPAVRVSPE